MNSILGFCQSKEHETAPKAETSVEVRDPVNSLVEVRFGRVGRSYTYFNDQFDLSEGDHVYVSGKFAGVLGTVIAVNYKFKISLADYECVIAFIPVEIRGTYEPILDKMVCYGDNALSGAVSAVCETAPA